MPTLPPTLSCRRTQQPFKKMGVVTFNWYTNPWRDNGGNAPGFTTDCSVFTFSVSGDTTSLGVCGFFIFVKKIFLTEKKGLKRKVQELETDKTSAILTVFRDCDWLLIPNGWAAVQGPPEIKETHGKISLGTHYCKKENVKARPKKVEQETRTGNVKT